MLGHGTVCVPSGVHLSQPHTSIRRARMTELQWSWLLAGMGVTGMYFVGRKRWEAFLWLIVMECLWIVFAVQTGTYGFIVGSLAYIVVYVRNANNWRTSNHIKE
jgi:nitrate reductase NapE component